MIFLRLLPVVMLATVSCGCDEAGQTIDYSSTQRLEKGLVIILPGIEGESPMNHDIRQGLCDCGEVCGLPIYCWGRPLPGVGMLLNQMDVSGNRLEGQKIARMIVTYQDNYPGKTVHVIGHSGGGGVAVFAAEAMPPGRKIDGLVLLSASISADYDLSKALGNCKKGILNVYNTNDTAMLVVGTTLTSTVDGEHGVSAGASGFTQSFNGLYQTSVDDSFDPHASTTRSNFIAGNVGPWLNAPAWPPAR